MSSIFSALSAISYSVADPLSAIPIHKKKQIKELKNLKIAGRTTKGFRMFDALKTSVDDPNRFYLFGCSAHKNA